MLNSQPPDANITVYSKRKKNEEAQLSIDLETEKVAGLYTEKRSYSAKPSITIGARSGVPVLGLGLLLGMGAGEAHGGYKPPTSCPQP